MNGWNELTDRECEVLALIAHGMHNWQIAEKLVISEYTVDKHVHSILKKLGVPNRTAASGVYLVRCIEQGHRIETILHTSVPSDDL